MRILLLLFILFPLLSLSQINQTDVNGMRQGLWQKRQPNGRLIYEGHFKDDRPVGEWKRYHNGGQIKAILQYRENSDSADTRMYDEFGDKVAEGVFLDQKKVGNWVYFSKKMKIAEEHYVNGIKDGVSRKYYLSGELMEQTNWVNGMQDGEYKVFYKTGEPYLTCAMKQNKRDGLCKVYDQNGILEMEARYKNNLRDGEWKFFDKNGNLQYTLYYKEGELLNPEVRDSIANKRMENFEKDKGSIIDPEKFMENPSEYMKQEGIIK